MEKSRGTLEPPKGSSRKRAPRKRGNHRAARSTKEEAAIAEVEDETEVKGEG